MAQDEYPTPADYGDALQHPGRSLYNFEDLREAEVERNSLRRPKGNSGNLAIVFKLTGAKGLTAAKFFKNPDADRERRYKAVSDYLHQHQTDYTVKFNYHEQGVYVNRKYFPVLLMDWVEGLPLGDWFHEKATAKDVKALLAMADEWVKLMTALQKAGIAHGDLQHGNVLVVKGKPILVDYDGMCVPALVGTKQLERGVDAYQHPERGDQSLGPNLDHFSAWIILISLRAVAADPGIYLKYKKRPGDTDPHENLLFVKEDIRSSGDRTHAKKADIWRDLQKSPDPQVREWSATLCDSIDQPFDRVPNFVIDPLVAIDKAIAAGDWDLVVHLSKGVKLPTDRKVIADLAQKRVDCRNALQKAVDSGDRRAICDAYKPVLLNHWDACTELVQHAELACKQLALLETLHAAAKSIGDGRTFVKEWDAHASDLARVPEARRYQDLAEQWRIRIAAADVFLDRLRLSGNERSIAAAWHQVEKRPPFHPDITSAQHERGQLACARIALLDRLEAIPHEKNEAADRHVVEGWDEDLLGSCREAAALRRRVEAARQRLTAVAELRKRIGAADKGGDEEPVVSAGEKLPYPDEALRKRVALAGERLLLEAELRRALTSDSDRAIKQVYEKAQKKHAVRRVPGAAERFQLALRRCELVDRLEAMGQSMPLDQQDELWEEVWQEELLRNCTDAKRLRPRYEFALKRLGLWRELDTALSNGAPAEVRAKAAAAAAILADYPPFKQNEPLIKQFIRKADDVDCILNKLKLTGSGTLLTENDLRALRTTPELFGADARRQIEAHVEQRLRTSLRLSAIEDGFDLGGGGTYITLRWTWPDSTLISCCYLALDDAGPPQSPGPRPLVCTPDIHHRMGGGMRCLAGSGLYATIWPVVNLGWKNLLGQPLSIGPIGVSHSNGAVTRIS